MNRVISILCQLTKSTLIPKILASSGNTYGFFNGAEINKHDNEDSGIT